MKGAKLRLKMGETIKEENIRVLVKDVKDRNFIKDLLNKAKQLKVDVSEKGGRYIFSGEKMKVNDVFNFAFDKSIKRGNYDPATMMHEEVDLDEAKFGHVHKGKVIAVGSQSDMNKSAKKKGAIVYPPSPNFRQSKKQDTNYVINSPGVKVGDTPQTFKEETIKEDGHTDVSSAVRQCKTIVEDATQMMGKLQSMNGEESLPTWWTNKLAVASNSMNKMRDYLLVPSMQEGLNEREKGIDKLPRQFLNPDKEVMVMKKNKVIVIDKKDQDRYTKQGWELAEVLDKEDEPKVKEVIKKLKKASDSHAGQAKDLEKAVSETTITGKDLLENKYKEEKNGAQHFSKIEEENYVWNFVYDDFGRTKLTTEPDKATHLVYTMEGKDNPQLLKLSEKEILDYKKGENYELSKKKEK